MMRKLWASLLVMGVMLLGGAFMATPVMATIGDICEDGNNIPDDLKEAAGCDLGSDDTAMPAVIYIINVALALVGIVAVAVIVYGGIIYVTSTGDAVKINRAKNSVLYGIVGLVISLLAFAIVSFVSSAVFKGSGSGSGSGSSSSSSSPSSSSSGSGD